MKLAVRREPGYLPGSGYHYMLFPIAMNGPEGMSEAVFRMMGHIIVEVDEERGKHLLEQARQALAHQVEVAILADQAEPPRV